MHIGLIGGIGPAATDFYYRSLISRAAQAERDLNLTMVHADSATLLRNLIDDRTADQCLIYDRLTQSLKGAGAECVVVTSIGGHFCIDTFAETSLLPVIDITQVLSNWIARTGMTRVGILGTGPVMASGMYGKLAPVEVIAPEGPELEHVHEAYVTLARSGEPTPGLRDMFEKAGNTMVGRGAEAILLGGTDLNAIFVDGQASFPIVDCASIHINEIAQRI